MKNDEKPIVNPYVMLREEFDDWAILFNPDTGRGFGLSPTGVYVWKLLDGEHTVDDMREALRRDAEHVPGEAGNQIMAFLEELSRHGLAGFEGERGYDDRGLLPPPSTCADAMKFAYEPPKLVNLSGQAARGYYSDCKPGSQAGECCIDGHLAQGMTCCATNGNCASISADFDCCTGTCASWAQACRGGGDAGNCPGPVCHGGSAAPTSCAPGYGLGS